MPEAEKEMQARSSFPYWSLGILLGAAVVFLFKRRMDALESAADPGERMRITLEEIFAGRPAAPEPQPSPKVSSSPVRKDNLKRLEGIGPKVQGVLNDGGIYSFAQLAAADQDTLNRLLEAAGYQYMDPSTWPAQARFAQDRDWEGLARFNEAAGRSK